MKTKPILYTVAHTQLRKVRVFITDNFVDQIAEDDIQTFLDVLNKPFIKTRT